MAVFFGEMQAKSDPKRMKAVVTVDQGKLRLVSGVTELGEWSLHTMRLEHYTEASVLMAVEDEELVLFMEEHERFVGELGRYLKHPDDHRREPTHPAFRKPSSEPVQGLGEELKEDVSREMAPILAEARHLLDSIPSGKPLWIGLAVFALLFIVLPGALATIALIVGGLGLLVGALAYADDKIAVRLPGPFTPAQLVAMGGMLLLVGIVVSAVRGG